MTIHTCDFRPGLARSDYRGGEYWPYHVEHRIDEQLLRFVEDVLYLIPLGPRRDGYDVLSDTRIDLAGVQALAEATELCWQAILAQDAVEFGLGVRRSFEAQVAMFPHMVNPTIVGLIERYRDVALGTGKGVSD